MLVYLYSIPTYMLKTNIIFLAPAAIEYPRDVQILYPLTTDETFALLCNATGHQRTMHWIRIEGQLDGDFDSQQDSVMPTDPDETRYGQSEVLRSRLPWIAPGDEARCEDVDRHNGVYICTANATAGGETGEDDQEINIQVNCELTVYYNFHKCDIMQVSPSSTDDTFAF